MYFMLQRKKKIMICIGKRRFRIFILKKKVSFLNFKKLINTDDLKFSQMNKNNFLLKTYDSI